MPNDDYPQQAKDALQVENFDAFFEVMTHVHSYEKKRLLQEALQLAKSLQRVDVLKRVVMLDYEYTWDKREIFEEVIKSLVDIDAIDTATGIVVFHSEGIECPTGWLTLWKCLKDQHSEKAEKLYCYLTSGSEKREVCEFYLQHYTIQADSKRRFTWLERYFAINGNTTYRKDSHAKQMTEFVLSASEEEFTHLMRQIKGLPESSGKNTILFQLVLSCIVKQNTVRAKACLALLPDSLQWVEKMMLVMEDETHFDVFEQPELNDYSLREEVETLVTQATTTLFNRTNESNFSKALKRAACLTPKHQKKIISAGVMHGIEHNKMACLLELLPEIKQFCDLSCLTPLFELPLDASQYRQFLSLLEDSHFYPPEHPSHRYRYRVSWLAKVPEEYIEEAREQRAQKLLQIAEKLPKSTPIHAKHPDYSHLIKLIDGLTTFGYILQTLPLIKRVAKASYRDPMLDTVLTYGFKADDSRLVEELIVLYAKPDNKKAAQAVIKSYKHYQQGKFAQAANCANQLLRRFPGVICRIDFVKGVFSECGFLDALSIVFNNKIVSNTNYASPDTEVSDFIIGQMTLFIQEDAETSQPYNIKKLVKKSKKLELNAEHWLWEKALTSYLEQNQWILVVRLLNGLYRNHNHSENRWGETPDYRTSLISKVADYLSHLPDRPKIIKELRCSIQDKELRFFLMRSMLEEMKAQPTSDNVQIMRQVPDKESRWSCGEKYIVNSLKTGNISFAKEAVSLLPKDIRGIWRQAINYIERKQFFECINQFFLTEKSSSFGEIYYGDVLFSWIIEQWLTTCNASDLLAQLQETQLKIHQLQQQKTINILSSLLQIKIKENHKFLFSKMFERWKVLIADKDAAFIRGLKALAPTDEPWDYLGRYGNWLETVKKLFTELLSADKISHAVTLVTQAIPYLRAERFSFTDVIKAFISAGYCDEAENFFWSAKSHIESYHWEQAIAPVCVGYFEIRCYPAITKFLQKIRATSEAVHLQQPAPHHLAYDVKQWVIQLIEQDNLKQAKQFCEELIPDRDASIYEPIIHALIEKGALDYMDYAKTLLNTKIDSPHKRVELQEQWDKKRVAMLKQAIGPERAEHIKHARERLTQLKRLEVKPEQAGRYLKLRNNLIVEMRGHLDKVFLAFYKQAYGRPPNRKGVPIGVYFPVVPDLPPGKTVKDQLKEYIKTRKMKTLAKDFPPLYQFLLRIQPLQKNNADYLWLRQLYKLANLNKHDHDLLPNPQVDGKPVDMQAFLPKMVEGVEKLLIELYQCTPLSVQGNLSASPSTPVSANRKNHGAQIAQSSSIISSVPKQSSQVGNTPLATSLPVPT